ncbi:hypothetical protein CWI39_0524p0010 [Hamiltosporidium magnivora]|uniref:Uncharacterized protein n=1 Tax=Hamiltosporidium magnivora TaxID=148818 RepID=A0A4Q9LF61_9MICR|nr:hypothetical protein CWI39_0524p0010 [Hamiltosporidium magnivora]
MNQDSNSVFNLAKLLKQNNKNIKNKIISKLQSQNFINKKVFSTEITDIKQEYKYLYQISTIKEQFLASIVFNLKDCQKLLTKNFSSVVFKFYYEDIYYMIEYDV